MSTANQKTLASYEANPQPYINSRNKDDIEDFYSWAIDDVTVFLTSDKIFEIGSGPGFFADHLESLGYSIERTDAAKSFVEFNLERGKSMSLFDINTDEFVEKYDAILAINVMQHLEKEEAVLGFRKIYDALNRDGRFIFTATSGSNNDEYHEDKGGERYFFNWNKDELRQALEANGFTVVRFDNSGYKNWVNITVEKEK